MSFFLYGWLKPVGKPCRYLSSEVSGLLYATVAANNIHYVPYLMAYRVYGLGLAGLMADKHKYLLGPDVGYRGASVVVVEIVPNLLHHIVRYVEVGEFVGNLAFFVAVGTAICAYMPVLYLDGFFHIISSHIIGVAVALVSAKKRVNAADSYSVFR